MPIHGNFQFFTHFKSSSSTTSRELRKEGEGTIARSRRLGGGGGSVVSSVRQWVVLERPFVRTDRGGGEEGHFEICGGGGGVTQTQRTWIRPGGGGGSRLRAV